MSAESAADGPSTGPAPEGDSATAGASVDSGDAADAPRACRGSHADQQAQARPSRRDPATWLVPPHSTRPWPLPRARSPRIELLRATCGADADPRSAEAAAAAFWADTRESGTPLVEDSPLPGHSLVTFLWRGEAPHGVLLAANRFTDFTDPADTRLEPIAGTDIHALTLELPDDWVGSYAIGPLSGPLPAQRLHSGVDRALAAAARAGLGADPLARTALAGDASRSVCALADAPAEPWPRDDAQGFRTVRVRPPGSGIERDLHVWSHPRAPGTAPLVLCLDGQDWRGATPIAAALARRVDEGSLPPLRLALLESGGIEARRLDLSCEPDASAGLLDAVVAATDELGARQTGPLVVAGQSLGGLFALLCATRHPERVGAAVAQSPSLWWPNDAPWQRRAGRWFVEDAAAARAGAPVVVQYGVLEWDLEQAARHARSQLAATGRLLEATRPGADAVTGGHDLAWWRECLPEAIARAVRAAVR